MGQWLALSAGLLLIVTVGLLIAAYVRLRRQNFLIRVQSREIEKKIRELVQQNRDGESLLHEKKQLVLLVSHDLKGPFNRIFALLQLLEMTGQFSKEQKEYVDKMYQVVGDGLSMVRNLVDARKLEERGMDPHPELIDLAYLVTSIVNQYRASAEKKKISVDIHTPEKLEFVTDKTFIGRIMENLLSNAVKFSAPNTKVQVSLSNDNNGNAIISVRDEGPGISVEEQQHLFKRFQKLTARPTGGETSTGLGLSIAKTLVTGMGGEILCESTPEEGSEFIVRLPPMKLKGERIPEPSTERRIS